MDTKQQSLFKRFGTLAVLGSLYAGSALAVYCPPGETPANKSAMSSCVANPEPKPQLDASKYTGAQKTEAEACNTINTAQKAVNDSSEEVGRISTDLDQAQLAAKKATGADHDAAVAKVKELKEKRKAEMDKLSKAQKDLTKAKRDHRKALKQEKKEGAKPLNCV